MKKNVDKKIHSFKKSKINGTKIIVGGPSKEAIEKALYELKKVVKDSGKLNELRDRQEFLKPSEKRRRSIQSAVRRQERLSEYEKYINFLSNN